MYDVVVIGAGVIGASVARELAKYDLDTIILEKTNDVACGTTKANSAIVHAGYDANANTNKGRFNALGNEMYESVCKELNVPFKRIGSLVVAFDEKDIPTLEQLLDNSKKLGIPNVEIIGKEKVREMEPNLSKDIVAALYAPTAGIVEPWELAIAYAENAIDNGVSLKLNTEVIDIEKMENVYKIKTNKGSFETKFIINCAGVYADEIHNMVSDSNEFEIKPRRGQYFLLDKEVGKMVNSVIFQCPTKLGKGVLIAPTVDGNLIIGPDAEDLDYDDKEATNTTGDRLDFVKNMAIKTCENIPFGKNITTFAGLRAEPSTGDFIIGESKDAKNFINCAGMKSPGLSSAPAIACYIAELVNDLAGGLDLNQNYNPNRHARIKFEELSADEKTKLIKENPKYGRIICRCEMITEGEIVDAIHRNAGGRTLNGIKRRVRPGAGRCQGGFCGPRVMEILARELDLDIEDILQENEGSKILVGRTKED